MQSPKIKNGFLQEPASLSWKGKIYHLEDIITHDLTENEYQIKEIQAKGIVTIVVKSAFPQLRGVKAYISLEVLNEYSLKRGVRV